MNSSTQVHRERSAKHLQLARGNVEGFALAGGEDNTTRARPRREPGSPLLADENDYEEKSPDLGRVRGSFRWVLWVGNTTAQASREVQAGA